MRDSLRVCTERAVLWGRRDLNSSRQLTVSLTGNQKRVSCSAVPRAGSIAKLTHGPKKMFVMLSGLVGI